jgi:hypothetical protein
MIDERSTLKISTRVRATSSRPESMSAAEMSFWPSEFADYITSESTFKLCFVDKVFSFPMSKDEG